MTRPKCFRGMELTEEDIWSRISEHVGKNYDPDGFGYNRVAKLEVKAMRLLPLWRKWTIQRERLWFALIGLGLDVEGDERDMPLTEMRRRIEWFIADAEGRREYEERVRATIASRVMREINQ